MFGMMISVMLVSIAKYAAMTVPLAMTMFGIVAITSFVLMAGFFNDPGITLQVNEKSERILPTGQGNQSHGYVTDGRGTGLDVVTTEFDAYPCQFNRKIYTEEPTLRIDTPVPSEVIGVLSGGNIGSIQLIRTDFQLPARGLDFQCESILDANVAIQVTRQQGRATTGYTGLLRDVSFTTSQVNILRGPTIQEVFVNMCKDEYLDDRGNIGDSPQVASAMIGQISEGRTGRIIVWGPAMDQYTAALAPFDGFKDTCRDRTIHEGDTFQDTQTTYVILEADQDDNEPLAYIFLAVGMVFVLFIFLSAFDMMGQILGMSKLQRGRP